MFVSTWVIKALLITRVTNIPVLNSVTVLLNYHTNHCTYIKFIRFTH